MQLNRSAVTDLIGAVLDGILSSVAAGDLISIQAFDRDGNIISPDGITLNEEAGIAFGGNSLTGLGAEGRVASAGTIDAIAIGNDVSTDASAGSAVVLG